MVMTKPITDKAEVAVEYPDKLYIGTFAHTARFDAHLDQTGISLTLELPGPEEQRKSVRMHFSLSAVCRDSARPGKDRRGISAERFSSSRCDARVSQSSLSGTRNHLPPIARKHVPTQCEWTRLYPSHD
jgi:hypothetical protein